MAEMCTKENRRRNLKEAERSDDLRPRVVKAIEWIARGGAGSYDALQEAKLEFCRRCIDHARVEGLQPGWKEDGYKTQLESARESLARLLGEKVSITRGMIYTHTCRRRVLDVFEAGLRSHYGWVFNDVSVPLEEVSLSHHHRTTIPARTEQKATAIVPPEADLVRSLARLAKMMGITDEKLLEEMRRVAA